MHCRNVIIILKLHIIAVQRLIHSQTMFHVVTLYTGLHVFKPCHFVMTLYIDSHILKPCVTLSLGFVHMLTHTQASYDVIHSQTMCHDVT